MRPGPVPRAKRFVIWAAAPLALAWVVAAGAQSAPPAPGPPPASFKVLIDQVAALFPALRTDVVEAAGPRVTLASGRTEGVQRGIELVVFREGRELYHPTTKKLLGRTEETVGHVVVAEVFENYSIATQLDGDPVRPGDHARVSAGKVPLTVLTLSSGVRSRLVEAAAFELIQELEQTGRFQIRLGDRIAVWLGEARISADEFMAGKGYPEAARRFNAARLLALNLTTVQGKPFMDVRLFSAATEAPLLNTALFVPPSVKPRTDRTFSSAPGRAGEVQVERRSLLARLLSGDFEPYQYSASAASIPIRALATFPFPVVSMDVAVASADKVARVVLTDGQRVFQYRLEGEKFEPDWTFDRRSIGAILSVQFADLDGDGVLEVVVNRQDHQVGMLGYILTTRNGRPQVVVEDIPLILLAVDETGDGARRGLWTQRYSRETFFTKGGAVRYALRDKDITSVGSVLTHDTFRVTGATFSNIAGQEGRVLAFVDDQHRLKITIGNQELFRSLTVVGGGLAQAHLRIPMLQTIVDKFVKVEPNPVSVDLDGDGIEEIIVPVNEDEAGKMAVVFRGPAGYRMQVVSAGFEGMITGLGALPGDGNPSLVVAVVQRRGVWRTAGETRIIMTVPE